MLGQTETVFASAPATSAALLEGNPMGFDIYGIRKKSEKGRYFYSNRLWWHGLQLYVLDACSDLFKEGETDYWCVNQGQRVSGRTATAIAKRLHELLESGAVKAFERRFKKEQRARLIVPCACVRARRKVDPKSAKRKVKCPRCHGTGIIKKDEIIYPFTEETVKDFAEFCQDSGGFEIW
jgi:DnaJ-class molecular chaperone